MLQFINWKYSKIITLKKRFIVSSSMYINIILHLYFMVNLIMHYYLVLFSMIMQYI